MPSARAVANFFVEQGLLELNPVTQLKLQKLVYYSYAWFIANNPNTPLFDDDIEAWRHGPVVRSVWNAFNQYRSNPITEAATELEAENGNYRFVVPVVDNELRPYLENVWETYKNYSAIQLSNMTHAPEEPWFVIRNQANYFNDHPVIPPAMIAESFRQKLQG